MRSAGAARERRSRRCAGAGRSLALSAILALEILAGGTAFADVVRIEGHGSGWRVAGSLGSGPEAGSVGTLWVWSEGRLCAGAVAVVAVRTGADLALFPAREPACHIVLRPGPGSFTPERNLELTCLLARADTCAYT